MFARRCLGVALFLLLAAAPVAHAQGPLLETLTVDPASSSPTVGTVSLKKGTKYTLEASGSASHVGPEGVGYHYDALWCYDWVKVASSSCNSTTQTRGETLFVGIGSDPRWAVIDRFASELEPYTDQSHLQPYRADHVYTVDFYAPLDGPLRAGGIYAKGCPGCQTTINGSYTIKIFGPASTSTPPPTTTPPPSGGTTTTTQGNPFAALIPKTFCPAGRARAAQAQAGPPPVIPITVPNLCQPIVFPRILTKAEEALDIKRTAIIAIHLCARSKKAEDIDVLLCVHAVAEAMVRELERLESEPAPLLPPPIRARAAQARRTAAAVRTARRSAREAARAVRAISEEIADARRAYAAAVARRDVRLAATVHAALKAYAGVYAEALAQEGTALRKLGTALRRAGTTMRLSARQARAAAKQLFSLRGLPRQAVAQLRARGYSSSQIAAAAKAIAKQVPARPIGATDGFKTAPKTRGLRSTFGRMTPADVFLVLEGLVATRQLDHAVASRLAAQLVTIQATCDPARRAALVDALVADARRSTPHQLPAIAASGLTNSRC